MPTNKITAILQSRCPRCRQGKIFEYSSIAPAKFDKLHKNCLHCGLRFEVEPGFFMGAVYVSYAFTVGLMLVSGFLIYHLLNDPSTWVYVSIVCALTIVLTPLIFRFSRVLYLFMFGGIDYNTDLDTPQKNS